MKLSKRLGAIVEMVPELPEGGCVADIGTDHGFVPICLVQGGKASRALAMDVRKGPLLRADGHIHQYGLEDQIETRLSDGLDKLRPEEAQAVVIAGMGGELMLRILRDGTRVREKVRYWILSPQSELAAFRHGLEELGLAIRQEVMVEEDGKYYTVMLAEPGQMHYGQEYQYRYGDCLIREKSPVLQEFLERERRLYEEILSQLSLQPGEGAKARAREMEAELAELQAAQAELGQRRPAAPVSLEQQPSMAPVSRSEPE